MTGKSNKEIELLAVGDIQPNRDEPETLWDRVAADFAAADLRYCQLECTISDQGVVRSDVRNPAHRVAPHNIRALEAGPFEIVSYAGNNNLDYGVEAFIDTLERLDSTGVKVVGAGRDLEEAIEPRYVEANGLTIAFTNVCSILRDGYAATKHRPGIAPLRVQTFYEPLENIYEQPGTPGRTRTVVDADDLAAILSAISKAREKADLVVACFHWGVHFTHDLAEYQPEVAYAAIDAGAGLVVGTHPHCLQAIDVYKGVPILYSLGNFAFEQPEAVAQRGVAEYLAFYGVPVEPSLKQHPHPRHCRMTALAKVRISADGLRELALVPAYFNDQAQPEPLEPGAPLRAQVVGLLQALSEEVGTRLTERGRELVVDLGAEAGMDTRLLLKRRKFSYPWLQRLVAFGPEAYLNGRGAA